MTYKLLTVAEVRQRSTGEVLYGDVKLYETGRVLFSYLEPDQDPETNFTIATYDSVLEFSKEWKILQVIV